MMDVLNTFQNCYDTLIETYSHGSYYKEVQEAKAEFAKTSGKLNEGEVGFEARVNQFLDWYVFDRPLKSLEVPPIVHYISNTNFESEELKNAYESLSKTLHSIFYVKSIKKARLTLLDIYSGKKFEIDSSDFPQLLFQPKQIIDGRVISFGTEHVLTKGFYMHPAESFKYIKKEMAHIRKNKNETLRHELLISFMKRLSKLYNLHILLKHVPVERIYTKEPIFPVEN